MSVCNKFFMTNNQTILLDRATYNITSASLIESDTKVLNLIFSDFTEPANFTLIGKSMEWKPLIWMQFEKERIKRLECLRIINCEGTLQDAFKQKVKGIFQHLDIEFIDVKHLGNWMFNQECKNVKDSVVAQDRIKSVTYSAGTMRLNRYVLLGWCQQNQLHDVGRPAMSKNQLRMFNNEYSRLAGTQFDMHYDAKANRFFGDVGQDAFNLKYCQVLGGSHINFVAHPPDYGLRHGAFDEKLWYTLICKTVPFFVGNVSENDNLKMYGFESYVGFDYSADSISNPIERWIKLLDDNKRFFIDIDESKKIHDLNKDIIEHNYDRLINTDWKKVANDDLAGSPDHVQEVLKHGAPDLYSLLS